MPLYATADDLRAEPGVPDDLEDAAAERLLQRATNMVQLLTRGVVYRTDADGQAIDLGVQGRLTRATVAQAALLAELDATRQADGPTQWESVSIGGVSLSGRRVASGVQVNGVPLAEDTLTEVQLLGPPSVIRG